MNARRLAIALLLGLALGALGCFRIGVTAGHEIPQSEVERIVPGQTTRADILRMFGAPAEASDGQIFARLFDAGEISADDLAALPFADLLVYEIADGNARVLFTFLFNWARVDIERDRLTVFFDEKDVVLYYGLTRQRPEPVPAETAPDVAAPPPRPHRGGGWNR